MAQRIVTLCDAHAANEEEAPGLEWEVTLRGPGITKGATWLIDLCEQDGKTLSDLAVMLDAVGRRTVGKGPSKASASAARVSAPSRARTAPKSRRDAHPIPTTDDGRYPCPLCDKSAANRKALDSHFRHDHPESSMAEAFGWPRPFTCPDCDFASVAPQGLAAHRKSVHGVAGQGSSGG